MRWRENWAANSWRHQQRTASMLRRLSMMLYGSYVGNVCRAASGPCKEFQRGLEWGPGTEWPLEMRADDIARKISQSVRFYEHIVPLGSLPFQMEAHLRNPAFTKHEHIRSLRHSFWAEDLDYLRHYKLPPPPRRPPPTSPPSSSAALLEFFNLTRRTKREAYGVCHELTDSNYLDIKERYSFKRIGVFGAFWMYLAFQIFTLLHVHIW